MSAIDGISKLAPEEAAFLESRLPNAVALVQRLPLVRVALPANPVRRAIEMDDVLRTGVFRTAHRSEACQSKDLRLEVGDNVYFHLGRAHRDYGDAAFALAQAAVIDVVISPFGVGQLDCDRDPQNPLHADGGCLAPVAHWDPLSKQITFLRSSTWDFGEWRERAAQFLAGYYGQLQDYFADSWDPLHADPEEIYRSATLDWRGRTFEARVPVDVSLADAARGGHVQWWSVDADVWEAIQAEVRDRNQSLSELFPLVALLPPKRRLSALGTGEDAASVLSRQIAAEVLL